MLMKAVQISKAGGDFELVEREIPQPGLGEVRIKVEACGICHSDAFVKEGTFPGITYPPKGGIVRSQKSEVLFSQGFKLLKW